MNELDKFYEGLLKEVKLNASAEGLLMPESFMELYIDELIDVGDIQNFQYCDNPADLTGFQRSNIGVHINGYSIDRNENTNSVKLDLFITDYNQRDKLEKLGKPDVDIAFKRLLKFFTEAKNANTDSKFFELLDDAHTSYPLLDCIVDYKEEIDDVNLYFLSERARNKKFSKFDRVELDGINIKYHFWDITRFHKVKSAAGNKEPIIIDFKNTYNTSLDCLIAHTGEQSLRSYLVVMPGGVLADIYNDHGPRLLEQNVRSFLQARGGVNKGIRNTILNEPSKFFSYNNGITATAEKVETIIEEGQLKISSIMDLQIVNGGQTTASLARAKIKDVSKADLSKIFVQMKLTVIDEEKQKEELVPQISQYANTQNKVNMSDLSSNHGYHIKIEALSRKIWAPPHDKAVSWTPNNAKLGYRETLWFYERSRGQYDEMLNKQSGIHKLKYPKYQLFRKTDLAKYMMVWEIDEPKWVNMGAQKNFGKFMDYISLNWGKKSFQDKVNELYFKRLIGRVIIWKSLEKLVQKQDWYTNGYRANIIVYTLAYVSYFLKKEKLELDYLKIWSVQDISNELEKLLLNLSKEMNSLLIDDNPSKTTSNVSEWAKKDACWGHILGYANDLDAYFTDSIVNTFLPLDKAQGIEEQAASKEKRSNDLSSRDKLNNIDKNYWFLFLDYLSEFHDISYIQKGLLKTAQRQTRDFSTKQCHVLNELLENYGDDFDKYSSSRSLLDA